MSMQLKQQEVFLGEGKKITIHEAGWDYSFRFSELEKEIAPLLEDPNHSEVFKFFCRNYYSLMASCVMEGEVPTAQEAFALPRLYLDNWYLEVWRLNEDIIGTPCPATIEHEEVEFRDGSKVFIYESQGLPSFVLKLIELENEALRNPLEDDPKGQMFISFFYPKMAASCNGSSDVPDALTVRSWPRSEIQKWMEASRRLNPAWYNITESEKEEEVVSKKKKVRKRSGG